MAILVAEFVVVSTVSLCVTAVSLEDLYPYGLPQDKQILTNDDGSSLRIDLDPPFRFYNQSYNGCHVSSVDFARVHIRGCSLASSRKTRFTSTYMYTNCGKRCMYIFVLPADPQQRNCILQRPPGILLERTFSNSKLHTRCSVFWGRGHSKGRNSMVHRSCVQ